MTVFWTFLTVAFVTNHINLPSQNENDEKYTSNTSIFLYSHGFFVTNFLYIIIEFHACTSVKANVILDSYLMVKKT